MTAANWTPAEIALFKRLFYDWRAEGMRGGVSYFDKTVAAALRCSVASVASLRADERLGAVTFQ